MQRDKNGNANNVVFYAILAHPSHMLCCFALLFYVHGKHLRSCRDGQLT